MAGPTGDQGLPGPPGNDSRLDHKIILIQAIKIWKLLHFLLYLI